MITSDRRQLKTLMISTSIDQISLEKDLFILISRLYGVKWQSKMLVLAIFDLHSSIVKSISIATYLV